MLCGGLLPDKPAVTGKVGYSTNFTGNATNRDLTHLAEITSSEFDVSLGWLRLILAL
jgi:hypothetical protein